MFVNFYVWWLFIQLIETEMVLGSYREAEDWPLNLIRYLLQTGYTKNAQDVVI